MVEMIDTHVHLNSREYLKDLQAVLERMITAGVTAVVNIGYDLASSRRALEQAHQYKGIYAAVGFHPHDAKEFNEDAGRDIRAFARDGRVVAIGETGLDYYRNLSPRKRQKDVFQWHLNLARELRLPVIVHDREAHGDTLNILKKNSPFPAGGVMHCYSGSYEMARECLKLGFYISFAGPLTYKNAGKLREVAAKIPPDRLLVETDAPYLTPEPYRGRRNEPMYVERVIESMANIRGTAVDEVKALTTANAKKLFGI